MNSLDQAFLLRTDARLDAVLNRVHQEFMASPSGKPPTIKTAYGWFGHWWTSVNPENLSKEIAVIVLANASRRNGILPGRETATFLRLNE